MPSFRTLSLALGFALLTARPLYAADGRWLEYEPKTVRLQGTVVPMEHFGPPNYGDTPDIDTKERVPILRLKKPVNVMGDPKSATNDETVRNVTEIHLVFESGYDFTRFYGREVTATGTLFHSHTGHHATKVLMTVKKIQARGSERNKPTASP